MTTQHMPGDSELSDSQRRLITSMVLNDLQAKVSKHHEILITGNGDVSMLERMRKIEDFVKTFRYWSRFLFGALILQTLAFLFGVAIAIIRFLPVLERLAAQP